MMMAVWNNVAGWFAKDPNVLRHVGHLLLQLPFGIQRHPRQIIISEDCFQLLKIPVDRIMQVVIKSTEKLFGSMSCSGHKCLCKSLFYCCCYIQPFSVQV